MLVCRLNWCANNNCWGEDVMVKCALYTVYSPLLIKSPCSLCIEDYLRCTWTYCRQLCVAYHGGSVMSGLRGMPTIQQQRAEGYLFMIMTPRFLTVFILWDLLTHSHCLHFNWLSGNIKARAQIQIKAFDFVLGTAGSQTASKIIARAIQLLQGRSYR